MSRVGIDMNSDRLATAKQFGSETIDISDSADPVSATNAWSKGRGVDAVLITASSKSDEIVHQAAEMCRNVDA